MFAGGLDMDPTLGLPTPFLPKEVEHKKVPEAPQPREEAPKEDTPKRESSAGDAASLSRMTGPKVASKSILTAQPVHADIKAEAEGMADLALDMLIAIGAPITAASPMLKAMDNLLQSLAKDPEFVASVETISV